MLLLLPKSRCLRRGVPLLRASLAILIGRIPLFDMFKAQVVFLSALVLVRPYTPYFVAPFHFEGLNMRIRLALALVTADLHGFPCTLHAHSPIMLYCAGTSSYFPYKR